MVRNSIFLLTIFALSVIGISKLATAHVGRASPQNVTVIYQTAFAGSKHRLIVEHCANENCSDTAQ